MRKDLRPNPFLLLSLLLLTHIPMQEDFLELEDLLVHLQLRLHPITAHPEHNWVRVVSNTAHQCILEVVRGLWVCPHCEVLGEGGGGGPCVVSELNNEILLL